MNCGCTKNLGCFTPGENIDFGILAPYTGNYTAEIFSVSGFTSISFAGTFGTPLLLPFTFNENSTTTIKIKFDITFSGYGMYYATTNDGACSFDVSGIIPQC